MSAEQGFVQKIDAVQIGYAAMRLGAGREYKAQTIDLATGLILQCRVGDFIEKNQLLATIHVNNEIHLEQASALVMSAIKIGPDPTPKTKLILGVVDKSGFKTYNEIE